MPPPSTAPPRKRAAALPADERRSAIVAAVIPLLVEHGETVTTREIAEAAGIAEGTIFRVFPDKDAVVQAAVESALDPAPLDAAIADLDPDGSLATVLGHAVAVLQDRVVAAWRLLSALGPRHHRQERRPATESPALVALLTPHRDELRLTPDEAARRLRSITIALTHPLLTAEPMEAPAIVDLFLHGAAREHRC